MSNLFYRSFTTERSISLRHPGLAEIFLSQDIGCDLAPARRHLNIGHFENDFATWITNHRGPVIVLKLVENIGAFFCKPAGESQAFGLFMLGAHIRNIIVCLKK